ncbi:NAM-associated domain-containing protein [Forsythia ovata]|uniref:NAM-associated domain-containing protein n=1 Tax=Forsythia ovata TaxID=205694 RepID=A0ABD1P445_9LAMI
MKREKDRKEFELREQVMKKEIELKEKAQKLREIAQRRQEQERIMNQDLSKLSPTVRASYEIFQAIVANILHKVVGCIYFKSKYLPTVHMKLFVLMTNDQFHGRKKNYKLKQFCHNNMEQESSICQDGEEVEQSVPAQVAMQIHEKYWAIWM